MKKAASVPTVAGLDRIRRAIPVIFGSVLLLTILLASGCSEDEVSVVFPTPPPVESTVWMFDVFGTGPDDVYACGAMGAMFHFNGTEWTTVSLSTGMAITTIWADESEEGDGTLYACGEGGRIWQNTGSGWSSMDSGTSSYLTGIGKYYDEIHVCGVRGTLRKLSGSSWSDTATDMVLRDSKDGKLQVYVDPVTSQADSVWSLKTNIASLVTVNNFFIGGAYIAPDYEEEITDLRGTDGMVIGKDKGLIEPDDETPNPLWSWQLRPLRADEIADSEWIVSSTSDPDNLANNYLGTSEGWVFQLGIDEKTDRLTWDKKTMTPRFTSNPLSSINDMWIDAAGNLYLVTDEGDLFYQSPDYNFVEGIGLRIKTHVSKGALNGIWVADRDNIFVVGNTEGIVYRYRHDNVADEFIFVSSDKMPDIAAKSLAGTVSRNKFGLPLP